VNDADEAASILDREYANLLALSARRTDELHGVAVDKLLPLGISERVPDHRAHQPHRLRRQARFSFALHLVADISGRELVQPDAAKVRADVLTDPRQSDEAVPGSRSTLSQTGAAAGRASTASGTDHEP
jgi:hypothetical protein